MSVEPLDGVKDLQMEKAPEYVVKQISANSEFLDKNCNEFRK